MLQRPSIKVPKVSLSAFRELHFVLKEAAKIAFAVRPKLFLSILLLSTFTGLAVLPSLYLNKYILDTVLDGIGKANYQDYIKTVSVLVLTRSLIEIFRNYGGRMQRRFSSTLMSSADAYMDRLLCEKVTALDLSTLDDPEFKNKYDKVRRQSYNRIWGLMNTLVALPQHLFSILSAIVPIFLFNPFILIIVVLLTIPGFLANSKIIKLDYDLDQKLSPKNRLWSWMMFFMLTPRNFMEPKVLGHTQYILNKLFILQTDVISQKEKLRNRKFKIEFLSEVPSWIFGLIYNVWLFILAITAEITVGTAQMLYSAANNFANSLGSLSENFLKVYEDYLYVVDLVWLTNLKPQLKDGERIPKKKFVSGIEFKNVWFKYPKTDKWILKDVNFKIGLRENIALIGENGAGKTTLIKLLGRFYSPTKGEILVDGVNILQYKQKEYWERLSVLFQDFEHYPFSVRESIGYGDVRKINNFKDIKAKAKLTGIDTYIESLPKKYETPLFKDFEGGTEPSGGQWQRIALARTLFKDCETYILDEPTSNVDPEAEEQIFDQVIDILRDKILILVSHRFSTVRRADRILVVDKGTITENGTHENLLKNNGTYAKLFKLQAKGYQ